MREITNKQKIAVTHVEQLGGKTPNVNTRSMKRKLQTDPVR